MLDGRIIPIRPLLPADGFNYFHQFVNRGIAEDHLFDLSFVKLREVSFGYSIPVANTSFAKFVQ